MKRKYAVIFEQAETNWAAYVPDLPGCITTGKTLDDTERNIKEAIELYFEVLAESGKPSPNHLHEQDPSASLHDALDWESQDRSEAIEGIKRGLEDSDAG